PRVRRHRQMCIIESMCINHLQCSMPSFNPQNFKNEDFLFSHWDIRFDIVIGNPPYVRYENINPAKRDLYKKEFTTFHYRADLYVLFFEHSLRFLSENGKHCFICSDRWLKNEYGKKLRALISDHFNIEYLIEAERMKAFNDNVLAYPAISLITNSQNKLSIKNATISEPEDLFRPIKYIEKKYSEPDNWCEIFLNSNTEGLLGIEEQGFSIGIGVATGADKIFISESFPDIVEKDLLLPLISAKDLSGNDLRWQGRYVLNPYDADGHLINLDEYPGARDYLTQYRQDIEKRHIVRHNRTWYALIDKIKPGLRYLPKILLPDISCNSVIFVDSGNFYPAHNIYYISGKSVQWLELLAAILMSSFVQCQMSEISNKMHGGIPRWQSQSLRKLRIPDLSEISIETREMLIDAYHGKDIGAINFLVEGIMSQSKELRLSRKKGKIRQLSIYDI
ncbi:MAG: Eco57I restriction-modification methylase domain-containing protein, partial [Muribaculaceae bacterium]|nr:Eco57I restriction-modification methylase domain-containing protein [Muribaculaceae bacterium]